MQKSRAAAAGKTQPVSLVAADDVESGASRESDESRSLVVPSSVLISSTQTPGTIVQRSLRDGRQSEVGALSSGSNDDVDRQQHKAQAH